MGISPSFFEIRHHSHGANHLPEKVMLLWKRNLWNVGTLFIDSAADATLDPWSQSYIRNNVNRLKPTDVIISVMLQIERN